MGPLTVLYLWGSFHLPHLDHKHSDMVSKHNKAPKHVEVKWCLFLYLLKLFLNDCFHVIFVLYKVELGYKMILNLPDLRLMENKKELEEFPSRKKQKEAIKLSSQFPLRGSVKSEFKIPAALFLMESHPWRCRRSFGPRLCAHAAFFLGSCVAFQSLPHWGTGNPWFQTQKCFIHLWYCNIPLPQSQPTSPMS